MRRISKMYMTGLVLAGVAVAIALVMYEPLGTTAFAGQQQEATPPVETLLESQDLAVYDSLREDIRASLSDEFMPHLISQGLNLEDIKSFLTLVVRAEKEAFDAHNANYDLRISADWSGSPTAPSAGTLYEESTCWLTGPTIWWNSQVVQSYSSGSCNDTMYQIHSHSWLRRDSDNQQSNSNVWKHYTTHAWSLAQLTRIAGTYDRRGYYLATEMAGGPYPKPPSGSLYIWNAQVP